MATLDIIIIAIIVIAAVLGAFKGLIGQIGTIAGLVLAIIVCRFWGADIADHIIDPDSSHQGIYRTIIYAITFVAVFIIVTLIAGLFGKALSKMHIRIIDRIGGALFSSAAIILVLSLILNIYITLVPCDKAYFDDNEKPWRSVIAMAAPKVLGFITTP